MTQAAEAVDIAKLVAQPDQLIAEIQQLVTDLQNAHAVFCSSATDGKRKGAASCLAAVVGYLDAIGVERHLREPLLDLWGALADAENGLSNPLTMPGKFESGTSTAPTKRAVEFGYAAAAVTSAKRAGTPVSTALLNSSAAIGVLKEQLETCRRNITANPPRAPKVTVDAYNLALEYAAKSGLPLTAQAAALLDLIKSRKATK